MVFKFTLTILLGFSILAANNFTGWFSSLNNTDFFERVSTAIFSDAPRRTSATPSLSEESLTGHTQSENNPAEVPFKSTVPEKKENDEWEKDNKLKNIQHLYLSYLHFAVLRETSNSVLSGNPLDVSFSSSVPLYLLLHIFRI